MSDIIKLRNIFREIFDDDEILITNDTNRNDIEDWDSVAHVKLVLAIEEEFVIKLTTDEVASIKSVGEFVKVIERYSDG